jgi:hypothetical protein
MLLLIFITSILSHGFMVHPDILYKNTSPGVRNYNAISYNIDSLRNPNRLGLCRNTRQGKKTIINLREGQLHTITLAISIGAQHIGPCHVEIFDKKTPNNAIIISPIEDCARPPIAQFDTNKNSMANMQCKNGIPPNLVTNDMCIHTWTFKLVNVNKINCKNCIIRWVWEGRHIPSAIEYFENCADVIITRTKRRKIFKKN